MDLINIFHHLLQSSEWCLATNMVSHLRKYPISILSHENIPGDDENLPDIMTNMVVDYYGNVKEANNVFFHEASDDYYLTWNKGHINDDIIISNFSKEPIWENSTFRLYRSNENPDMIFTGRGFL